MNTQYIQEMLAMLLIGDGLVTAVEPRRHLNLWKTGPEPFGRVVDTLLHHTLLARIIGGGAVFAGLWWASQQKRERRQ